MRPSGHAAVRLGGQLAPIFRPRNILSYTTQLTGTNSRSSVPNAILGTLRLFLNRRT
jgi:hypothetical protein